MNIKNRNEKCSENSKQFMLQILHSLQIKNYKTRLMKNYYFYLLSYRDQEKPQW